MIHDVIYFLLAATSDWYVARAENVVHLKCEHLSSLFLQQLLVVVLLVRKKVYFSYFCTVRACTIAFYYC